MTSPTTHGQPSPSEFAVHWTLDPGITFLNHGSFGACPKPVLEAQSRWRERLERGPVQFLARDLPELLDSARAELAAFVGAAAGDIAFVPLENVAATNDAEPVAVMSEVVRPP